MIDVKYVYQELDKLPEGYSVPDGRKKPWGTAHAILCCKDVVKENFTADVLLTPDIVMSLNKQNENDFGFYLLYLKQRL